MTDSRSPEEKIHLSFYDEKARNVLKNLSLGTNMFITYDEKADPIYLVDSIVHVLNNEKSDIGKINKENTQITIFNDNINQDFIIQKSKELAKDKNKTHIIIINEDDLLSNSPLAEDGEVKVRVLGPDFLQQMKEPPKNVKFVLIQHRKNYYANISNPVLQDTFGNFGEASVHVLCTEQAKKAFKEQPLLMRKVDVPLSRQAIDRVIETCALLKGDFIGNIQDVMKKMAAFYVGKKEINEKDAKNYLEEIKNAFKLTGEDSSIEIVFDTGKQLKDILGKDSTKKEAETFVRQIKSGKMGTKGAIIYSQDGYVGSGRKFTAKAIAGETRAPYVEINAYDFGTEKTSLFEGGGLSPEDSIKKLFSLLTTQAEANPHKAAVLHIDNFEYFSVGEMVSEYHQKAMAQLLREMENATKKGLNILVLGSVSNPEYIGEATLKSFKFTDMIEVESPSINIEARKEILSHFLKKEKAKLSGSTEAENKELIKLMAEITESFPFVNLVNLVNKIKTVAFERKHKQIDSTDIVEAYLQLTTGRPALRPIAEHRKKIVASHECQHAFNLEYMHMLAEEQNIPWHLGGRVSFITLDPRGSFGGAMYYNDLENEEYSFEKLFTSGISEFGGHSAEKHFYNIDGSWGITADMEMATSNAEKAIGLMGQSRKFGKKSLAGMLHNLSEVGKEIIEAELDVRLQNQCLVSDLITKFGTTFNQKFTENNWSLVGTGNCLILGDDFRSGMKAWFSNLPKDKLEEQKLLNELILEVMESTKQSKVFDINAETVPPVIKNLYKSVACHIR